MTPIAEKNYQEYSTMDLFRELKERIREEGDISFEAYQELVDELVEEKRAYGFFDDNENLPQIKTDLERMWSAAHLSK